MKYVAGVLIVCLLGVCGIWLVAKSAPAPEDTQEQLVNNEFALKHIDKRMESMTDAQKLQYLALNACAVDMAMLGVYGKTDENPLAERWNELSDRYNRIWSDAGAELEDQGLGDSLTVQENQLCKDDHPVG